MSTHVVNAVKRQLKDSAITFTDEWFEACVNWVIENNPSSQVTQDHLKNEVMGQWMDADLSELNSSCLPAKLVDIKLVTLPGRYSLQVNYAEDIGESSYNQWNKLKKLENENTNVSADTDTTEIKASWEPKARRCIYLTITDGSQEVYGMEMVPIPCLSVEMKPGTKITISGPVDCRRGVLQLQPRHVRVIGGEVEGLIEQYAREKILKSRLNQDGQQQQSRPHLPRPTYKKPPTSLSSKSKGKQSGATQSLPANNNSSSYGRSTQPSSNPTTRKSPRKWNGGGKSDEPVHPELEGIDFGDPFDDPFGDDDADFMEIDETLLISQASRINRADQTTQFISQSSAFGSQNSHQGSSGRQQQHDQTTLPLTQQRDRVRSGASSSDGKDVKFKPSTSTSAFTETSHFKQPSVPAPVPVPVPSFSNAHNSDAKFKPPVPVSSSASASSTKFKPTPSATTSTSSSSFSQQRPKRKEEIPEIVIIDDDDEDDDDELFANISMICESKISRPESPPTKRMKIISKIPYQYIKVIKDNLEQFDRGHVVFVKACVATLLSNIKMGQDGGWSLIVSLNDGSGFLESPISSEMLNRVIGFTPAEMKRMKASGDSSAKNKITSGMSNLSTKLCHMNGIFGIKILPSGPVITSFTQVENRHVLALKGRLAEIS